jgi:hypothetical protein
LDINPPAPTSSSIVAEDVHHVVHRDDAEHAFPVIHDRNSEQVVLAYDFRYLLLVLPGRHGYGVTGEQVAHTLVGL